MFFPLFQTGPYHVYVLVFITITMILFYASIATQPTVLQIIIFAISSGA
jgi:hypothetical protein